METLNWNGERSDTMATEAQRKARDKYNAQRNRMTIDFYPTETDLWEHISKQEKKATYIKDLIRKDMKGE